MSKRSRKRTRQEFESPKEDETNKRLINNALKQIHENDEVSEPTKKKVRTALQSKLNVSKSYIKQNKQLINTLIQKYWITPPQISNNTNNNNNNNNNKNIILSLPDHIQQHIFLILHPKLIYLSLPSVCKWWHHLLHKQSFLHSLCNNILQLQPQQIPNTLQLINIIPFINKCCLNCSCANTFNNIYGPNNVNTQDMICWIFPICEICFNINSDIQGIYLMHARTKYRLSDYDLYCCKYKKMGKTYLLHSDVIQVAKDKYGDIAIINQLSFIDIGAINSQRKRCYNKKCKELKKELFKWIYEQELKRDVNESEINNWNNFELNKSVLKKELNEFFKKYHNGYAFFGGAHCKETVGNFNRKYMDLLMDKCEIKSMLNKHINRIRKLKYEIENMDKKEIYNDLYADSWMDGRFGGYGDYI